MFVPYARPNGIIAVGVILPLLCIIAFVLRIYARSSRKQVVGIDDRLLVPAVVYSQFLISFQYLLIMLNLITRHWSRGLPNSW
jgi:hypothetical protein